jgi:hypothetical protein
MVCDDGGLGWGGVSRCACPLVALGGFRVLGGDFWVGLTGTPFGGCLDVDGTDDGALFSLVGVEFVGGGLDACLTGKGLVSGRGANALNGR